MPDIIDYLIYFASGVTAVRTRASRSCRSPLRPEVIPDMGRAARYKTPGLADKLRRIREVLGLTQGGMLDRLDLPRNSTIIQSSISQYERGLIEPPLIVLTRYADVANVSLDVLARPELELPEEVPSPVRYAGGVTEKRKRAAQGGPRRRPQQLE